MPFWFTRPGAPAVVLLFEDQPVEVVGAATAVLDGPRDGRPASFGEGTFPLTMQREACFGIETRQGLRGYVRLEPGARLGAKYLLFDRGAQIHAGKTVPGSDEPSGLAVRMWADCLSERQEL